MIFFRHPSSSRVDAILQSQIDKSLTYEPVGASGAGFPPPGFHSHRVKRSLGRGPEVYRAALAGFQCWAQFDTGWTSAVATGPIAAGTIVGVVTRAAGVWSLNCCRIIHVEQSADHFAFTFGTLPEHAERGEERFELIRDPATGHVTYRVAAYFRPSRLSSRLVWPWLHGKVNQFRHDSAEALQRWVDQRVFDAR